MVFPPNHETVNVTDAERKHVIVAGCKVECWVARSPGARTTEPRALVLFFVGKGDRTDRWTGAVASAWAEHPVEVWGMNYPGSGGSEGNADITKVIPDALAVYDAARQSLPGAPIFIHAGSFGTTVGLGVAARRPVVGLILQNPPPLRQLILGRYGWWNLWLLAGPVAMAVPPELDSITNAAKVAAPAIFILAGRDTTVPPEYQKKVVAAYAGEKRLVQMPWATHDDALSKEAATEFAKDLDWLWSNVLSFPTTQPAGK